MKTSLPGLPVLPVQLPHYTPVCTRHGGGYIYPIAFGIPATVPRDVGLLAYLVDWLFGSWIDGLMYKNQPNIDQKSTKNL